MNPAEGDAPHKRSQFKAMEGIAITKVPRPQKKLSHGNCNTCGGAIRPTNVCPLPPVELIPIDDQDAYAPPKGKRAQIN